MYLQLKELKLTVGGEVWFKINKVVNLLKVKNGISMSPCCSKINIQSTGALGLMHIISIFQG